MTQKERIYVVACGVLAIDIARVAREMDVEVETRFMEGGLHENPTELRSRLQAAIDEASASGSWDRIAIGYGICGRGTVDLRAGSIPLVIPRVHDCISLFLGGNAAYQKEFKRFPGTYYISAGWYEEKTQPLSQKRAYAWMGDRRVYYDELVKKYGEPHARETFDFLNSWQRNYQRAAFIDTGAGNSDAYAQYARDMAGKYGWQYEKLQGKPALLKALLTTRRTTADILVVPPRHVTLFDPHQGGLKAGPVLAGPSVRNKAHRKIEVLKGPDPESEHWLQTGLGIDAGGTYTDAVLYDLPSGKVLCKNKALTTKWDFTVGIREALTGLDKALLPRTELVSVSTTLATNAIVEGEGQKVGLLIMPPYGLFEDADIPYEPKAVISGSLEISGTLISPVDEEEVRKVARSMIDHKGVEAFAVSGYAGCINPEHELQVKRILREETGCLVTCGHELSDLLNFRTRAQTAVLNARIVPRLERLITHLQEVLDVLGVSAPVMVVKGDGSLMSSPMAIERPVETILSGPAASVAGARFLTDEKDAIVVDMGGTTTDTAALENGQVRVAEQGSHVGGSRTHVKALEIRTSGLGGDSLISYESNAFTIGPRRVAPMAWLGSRTPGPEKAMKYAQQKTHIRTGSSKALHFFTLTGHSRQVKMTESESRIVALLKQRPYSMDELVDRTHAIYEGALPLARLEENYIIQRCGLTPTDLLHVTGQFDRWDRDTSRQMCHMFATLCGLNMEEMVVLLLDKMVQRLALELMKKQLDTETNPDAMDSCEVCQAMIANLFNGGGKDYSVHFTLNRPVIGIGAPIAHFLPQAAKLLGTRAILPEHADVANAIGAITSHIAVRRRLKVKPDQDGGFLIEGLAGALHFETLQEAEAHAKNELGILVRKIARAAGTSQATVEMQVEDCSAKTAHGDELFLERSVVAQLIGKPDIALGTLAGTGGNRAQSGTSL
jgi:N-methylhydantoinase A/oxoprolinase/acetone carboxylase beta subunit